MKETCQRNVVFPGLGEDAVDGVGGEEEGFVILSAWMRERLVSYPNSRGTDGWKESFEKGRG